MNDLTTQPPSQFNGSSALITELGKMLGLVAPIAMTADQQTLWLASAAEALQDIRADEVREISAEIRRSVTRHQQIVPAIAERVAELRQERSRIRMAKEEAEAYAKLPPVRRHIADRDRGNFTADDWAELNEYLELMGATARYHSDGSRYTISPTGGR